LTRTNSRQKKNNIFMQRNLFFINPRAEVEPVLTISGDETRHLCKVLRKKAGEIIHLSDGEKYWHVVRIVEIREERLTLEILETHDIKPVPGRRVVLVIGLPKRSSMELILQKATELGVDSIVPVRTTHAFYKNFNDETMKRWDRIVREAAKQSGRHRLLRIAPVQDWNALFQKPFGGARIILHEQGNTRPLQDALSRMEEKEVTVCIGPEGGFTPEEVARAEEHGFDPVHLGPQILRTETAAIALSAILRYAAGGSDSQGKGRLP